MNTGSTSIVVPAAASGGSAVPEIKTADFSAVAGHVYQVDTSGGAVAIVLPTSPTAGMACSVEDAAMAWGTNHVTFTYNGTDNINAAGASFVANVSGDKLSVCYINSTVGWSIK